MIYIRSLQDVRILQWAQNKLRETIRLNPYFDPNSSTVISIVDDQNILGAVIFTNYQPPATVEMSIVTVSPKWCNRQVLYECFRYCFETLEVKRIYTQVKGDNKKALDLNRRLGFKEIAVLPDYVVDMDDKIHDNHVFTMTKDECKWYGK